MMFGASWVTRERLRSVLWVLPLLSLLLATLACGFSVGSHYGYQPPPATHLTASQLRLDVHITGQYEQYGETPVTLVYVQIFETPNSRKVSLADKAILTCNGVDIEDTSDALGRSCPQQPPGGAYHLVYTDEHGAKTTVVIPVPLGAFAILSPEDGATVPIPTNGVLPVRYTIPTAPANGSVAIDNVTAACSVSAAQPCGAVYANLRPTAVETPGQGVGAAMIAPFAADLANTTPLPGKTPTRGSTPTQIPTQGPTPLPGSTQQPTAPGIPPATPTVVVTQNGDTGTILLTGDYSGFQPAKGFLSLSVEAHVTPDPGGFAAVTASYSDTLQSSFTWIR